MESPDHNKIPQRQPVEKFGSNAKLLEEHLARIDFRVFTKAWAIGLVMVCVTLFGIVASVSFALSLF